MCLPSTKGVIVFSYEKISPALLLRMVTFTEDPPISIRAEVMVIDCCLANDPSMVEVQRLDFFLAGDNAG